MTNIHHILNNLAISREAIPILYSFNYVLAHTVYWKNLKQTQEAAGSNHLYLTIRVSTTNHVVQQ